ncbi:DUF2637 domain-containing protein [Kitasatospora phosalacinea]|uniref:DUF2637 domain-containing protein n=1 Tax=Kitasatospora phosalacinea TaxID=2065 RepID=UPI0005273965|nr:DUF2637 domain-containing protein [Kitasatospora phosalacinea]
MSRAAKFWMVTALLVVVAMAFRVSWNALRDVAVAIGADKDAAFVYPLVVDGLMALALVAALVLPQANRSFALRVLAGYTVASLVLNYVHGLVPTLHNGGRARLADWAPAHWTLVLLASSLPVGSIFFGSDLVAKVLHHKPEPEEIDRSPANRSVSDLRGSADPESLDSVYESPDPQPTVPAVVVEPVRPVKSVAAQASRSRRATGTVPKSARSARPTRTPDELLGEARSVTADWPDDRLTADAIRTAVRTSAVNARTLRDALKAERAVKPILHAVPEPDETGDDGPALTA